MFLFIHIYNVDGKEICFKDQYKTFMMFKELCSIEVQVAIDFSRHDGNLASVACS